MIADVFDGWGTTYAGHIWARRAYGRSLFVLYLDKSWGFLVSDAGRIAGQFDAAWTAAQARDEGLAALDALAVDAARTEVGP